MFLSTIAAISTPRGKGGVALIRISGSRAFAVAQALAKPRGGKDLLDYPKRCAVYCEFRSPGEERVLDDGLVTLFAGPSSFTGEDVAELCCHGGEMVSALILEACLRAGAVMAGPGEFSRRALMNGKLTLTAAEGIADLLDAKTEEAAYLSSAAARGKLSEKLESLSRPLLAAAASLWAYLDYPEEDLQSFSDEGLCRELEGIRQEALGLLATFSTGKAVEMGVRTLIVGKPNVGKSTFFNALAQEDRAIVTEIPGTTRDLIELPVRAGRVLLNLVDTAGLRKDTQDVVERIGMQKVRREMETAEVIFALFDSSRPLDADDRILLDQLSGVPGQVFPILTKSDLAPVASAEELDRFREKPMAVCAKGDLSPVIARVEEALIRDENALREGAVITNLRQKSHVEKLAAHLLEAITHVRTGAKDLASLDLESAVGELDRADGKSAGEAILNEVFSRFCVGK